jgi:hypothetical protein
MTQERFTIFSIPGPNHVKALVEEGIAGGWDYALKAIEFIETLNPDTYFDVVFGHLAEFGEVPVLPNSPKINFITHTALKSELKIRYPNQPSSQHGALLNFTLAAHRLTTQYYAILDPDCYLLLPNAFVKLREAMENENLTMMGVSYPTTLPKTYYWDFPTAYFQIMNSNACPPSDLNFLPDEKTFVVDKRQPGGAGVPSAKSTNLVFKLPRFARRFVFRISVKLLNENKRFLIFLSHLHLNLPYKENVLFRDTGWSNREKFLNSPIRVIPHLVQAIEIDSGFDALAYADCNPDVAEAEIDPSWHFFTNGIHENRPIGHQHMRFRLLRKYLGKSFVDSKTHPATSITMGESIFRSIMVPIKWGKMEQAFEYHWDGKPFCLHLGHSGKSSKFEDMFKLNELHKYLINIEGLQNDI